MSKKSFQTTKNNNDSRVNNYGGDATTNPYHLLQQYRSPPRIEATITVPPSHEKSVINARDQSPMGGGGTSMLAKTHFMNQQQQALPSHESSNSVAILKKLNSTRSIGQGSGSASNKAKDRYFN